MPSPTGLSIDAPMLGVLVTSDPSLGQFFQEAVRPLGVKVEVYQDADWVEREWVRPTIRFGVIDLAGPTSDRLRLVRSLGQGETPVLTVTSENSGMDRILSLELGAQDSISRPIAPREIATRILLMAGRGKPAWPSAAHGRPFEFSGIAFDPRQRLLRGPRRSMILSDRLNNILELLVNHEGEILSRRDICELLRLTHIDDGCIRTHMCRLRAVLAEVGAEPDPIRTISGRGYVVHMPAVAATVASIQARGAPAWRDARQTVSS